MPGRVFSGPGAQPAEVTTRVAPAGVPAGRVPATKVTASGMAASASASVLGLCKDKETDYGQPDRKDARRPHKEGSSSGHWPSTPDTIVTVYSCSGGRQYVTFRSKVSAFCLRKRAEPLVGVVLVIDPGPEDIEEGETLVPDSLA